MDGLIHPFCSLKSSTDCASVFPPSLQQHQLQQAVLLQQQQAAMLSAVSGQYPYPPLAKPYPEAPWMPQHGAATAAHALATQQAMMTAQMAAHAAHAAQARLIPCTVCCCGRAAAR